MKRRQVLKGLAGTAALCALPRAGLAATRASSAGRFALMLDGSFAGYLQAASGGLARADVIAERAKEGTVVRKHIGGPVYEDIVIEFGPSMTKSVYDWIKSTLEFKSARKNGAIVSLDATNVVQSTLEFTNAVISEVGIPALDAAAKDPCYFQLKLAPESTRSKKGDGSKVAESVKAGNKAMLPSNFRLSLAGLDTVSPKVSKIEALVVKQKITSGAVGEKRVLTKEPASIEFPNLVISVAESAAGPLYDWHEDFVIKGNNGQDKERTATLEFLTLDQKTALFTLQFAGVGIFRLESDNPAANSDAVRRVRASLYCEELHFDSNLGA